MDADAKQQYVVRMKERAQLSTSHHEKIKALSALVFPSTKGGAKGSSGNRGSQRLYQGDKEKRRDGEAESSCSSSSGDDSDTDRAKDASTIPPDDVGAKAADLQSQIAARWKASHQSGGSSNAAITKRLAVEKVTLAPRPDFIHSMGSLGLGEGNAAIIAEQHSFWGIWFTVAAAVRFLRPLRRKRALDERIAVLHSREKKRMQLEHLRHAGLAHDTRRFAKTMLRNAIAKSEHDILQFQCAAVRNDTVVPLSAASSNSATPQLCSQPPGSRRSSRQGTILAGNDPIPNPGPALTPTVTSPSPSKHSQTQPQQAPRWRTLACPSPRRSAPEGVASIIATARQVESLHKAFAPVATLRVASSSRMPTPRTFEEKAAERQLRQAAQKLRDGTSPCGSLGKTFALHTKSTHPVDLASFMLQVAEKAESREKQSSEGGARRRVGSLADEPPVTCDPQTPRPTPPPPPLTAEKGGPNPTTTSNTSTTPSATALPVGASGSDADRLPLPPRPPTMTMGNNISLHANKVPAPSVHPPTTPSGQVGNSSASRNASTRPSSNSRRHRGTWSPSPIPDVNAPVSTTHAPAPPVPLPLVATASGSVSMANTASASQWMQSSWMGGGGGGGALSLSPSGGGVSLHSAFDVSGVVGHEAMQQSFLRNELDKRRRNAVTGQTNPLPTVTLNEFDFTDEPLPALNNTSALAYPPPGPRPLPPRRRDGATEVELQFMMRVYSNGFHDDVCKRLAHAEQYRHRDFELKRAFLQFYTGPINEGGTHTHGSSADPAANSSGAADVHDLVRGLTTYVEAKRKQDARLERHALRIAWFHRFYEAILEKCPWQEVEPLLLKMESQLMDPFAPLHDAELQALFDIAASEALLLLPSVQFFLCHVAVAYSVPYPTFREMLELTRTPYILIGNGEHFAVAAMANDADDLSAV